MSTEGKLHVTRDLNAGESRITANGGRIATTVKGWSSAYCSGLAQADAVVSISPVGGCDAMCYDAAGTYLFDAEWEDEDPCYHWWRWEKSGPGNELWILTLFWSGAEGCYYRATLAHQDAPPYLSFGVSADAHLGPGDVLCPTDTLILNGAFQLSGDDCQRPIGGGDCLPGSYDCRGCTATVTLGW